MEEKKKYNLDKMRWEAVLACTDKILENLDIGKERPWNVGAVVKLMQSKKGESINAFLKIELGVNRRVLTDAWQRVITMAESLDEENRKNMPEWAKAPQADISNSAN